MVTFLTLPKTSFSSHLSCTLFPKSTNLITQVDPQCLPVVVPLNSSLVILIMLWHPWLGTYLPTSRIPNMLSISFKTFIFTMDVKSLYTVIPHHNGLRALKFFLDKRPVQEPSTSVLVRLAELVLTLNNFSFDGEHYQQISGLAMGTKMGPNYANLFVGFVEKQIFEQYADRTPDYLGRYIDDLVGTASCSRGELEQFINFVNNFYPALQFTWEISETSVSFLDILVSINGNRLVTSVFYKPTDSHSYLLYSSSHPNHTRRSIPFSQFLCLCRLCSEDEDFHTKSLEMRDFFVQRGYPTSLLDTAFLKASQIPRSETLTNPVTNVTENNQIPLVLIFHPFNFKVRDIIRMNFHILKNDPETSSIFSNNP